MKASRIHIILASIAILATAVLAVQLAPHELMAQKSKALNLEKAIPKQFGAWTVVPDVTPVTPDYTDTESNFYGREANFYSQEVARGYSDGRGHIVMLLVAYGPVQTNRLKAHRPELCYTAAGFRVSPKFGARVTYRDNVSPLKVQRLIAQREARFEPISYWMRVGDEVADGVFERQLIRLKYGLQGIIPDGALIRVSTVGLPQEASFHLQDQFIRDLLDALPIKDRMFFTGKVDPQTSAGS